MRNRTRLSIDDQIGNHMNKAHSQAPFPAQHPMIRKKSSEILSIHKDLQNSTELTRPFPTLYPPTAEHPKKKHSQRYKPQIDSEQNEASRKLEAGFMSATENNRVTFCKSPTASDQILAFRAINQEIEKATSQSQSSKRTERQFLKYKPRRKQSQIYRQNSQKSLSQHQLEKAVIDLEEHNKNIMIQTKETVMNFQAYIQQLLESNQQLESNLLEYENYIETLQNQRATSLEKQKQREVELEKALRENIIIKRDLSGTSQSSNLQEVTQLKQKILNLENQLISKQELIKLLQDSVGQKQNIIKKMTQFNNQMCLQILNLKTNGIQTMSDIQNESNRWLSKNKSSQNFKINEEMQNNIAELQTENARLKEQNNLLIEKIKEMTLDDEVLISYIDDQINIINIFSEKLSLMTKNLKSSQKYTNSNQNSVQLFVNTSFNGKVNRGMIVKNKGGMKLPELNEKNTQACEPLFDHNFELSEIYPKGSDRLDLNFNIFEQDNLQAYRVMLKKIDHLLQVLCNKLKKSNHFGLSKPRLQNIMRTISSTFSNDGNEQNLKENNKNNNILFNLDDQEDSNFTTLIKKNEQILTKAAEIKKKLKNHISVRNNDNDDILSARNVSVERLDFSLNDHISKGLQNSQNSVDFLGHIQKKHQDPIAQIFSES